MHFISMWPYLRYEEKCEEYCGAYQQSQTKQSSMHLVIVTRCKLHHCQQSQDDAVDVNDERNLFGVVESLDLHSACVEGHKHGHELQESLVCIGHGQPHDGIVVLACKHIVVIVDVIFLNFVYIQITM